MNETDGTGQKIKRPTVEMIAQDSITVGEDFLSKLFLTECGEDFIVAFTDCVLTDSPSIDPTAFEIDACKSKLFSQGDRVSLAFRPLTPGTQTSADKNCYTRQV